MGRDVVTHGRRLWCALVFAFNLAFYYVLASKLFSQSGCFSKTVANETAKLISTAGVAGDYSSSKLMGRRLSLRATDRFQALSPITVQCESLLQSSGVDQKQKLYDNL